MTSPHTIDAQPYPFCLPETKPCLIVIDMQRDFIEPGGFGDALGNDVSRLKVIIPTVKKLIEGFRKLDLPIVHTRECHKADLSDCPPAKLTRGKPGLRIGDEGPMGRILIDGEAGNEILEELKPIEGELELTKRGKGSFYATDLDDYLKSKGVSHLFFAGVTTEVCVQTSMREANDRGYECLLVEDATESYFPEFKQAVIEMTIAQGAIVGWVATCDQCLDGLEAAYG